MEKKFQPFWELMDSCDWSQEGDDQKVLRPLVENLARRGDEAIFAFEDLMSELLYNLDSRQLAQDCEKAQGFESGDAFLYSRCVALINGPAYYEKVRARKEKGLWDMEFEALLSVPMEAWALLHRASPEDYPHCSPLSYETGSNRAAWEK